MKKTKVFLVDNIDGSEAERTISFAFNGISYQIDLNAEHANKIEDDFAQWIRHARRTGGRAVTRRSGATAGASDSAKIRQWAQDEGLEVSQRGRIPASIVEQYRQAHQ